MNNQLPERRNITSFLDVHSIFFTIQCEGPFAGVPAIFVRLAGCNLQCPNCDTDYTSKRKFLSEEQIVEQVLTVLSEKRPFLNKAGLNVYDATLVVITGGEPFRQNLKKLFNSLIEAGFFVQVETNGSLRASESDHYNTYTEDRSGVYVVTSPKTSFLSQSVINVTCAYKYIVGDNEISGIDGLPGFSLGFTNSKELRRPPIEHPIDKIYIQPEQFFIAGTNVPDVHRNRDATNNAIRICKERGYTLSIQLHKILGIE